MRLVNRNALAAALALFAMPMAFAQTASTPLPGYECKMLNITEQQSMDPSFHVVVRSGPSEISPAAGWASAVVIIKMPEISENGFLQMLLPNNRTVWIAADDTKPYRSVSNPVRDVSPRSCQTGASDSGLAEFSRSFIWSEAAVAGAVNGLRIEGARRPAERQNMYVQGAPFQMAE